MSNQVVVVLDRDEARSLGPGHGPISKETPCACGAVDPCHYCPIKASGRAKLRAALEVDPETRIEHIARAIYGAFLSDHGKSPDTHDSMWRVVCTKKDQYRRQAQAALSALCENPGQEKCPECDGTGRKEVTGPITGPGTITCPTCNGSGSVDEASPTPVGHDEPGVETGSGEDEN